MSFTKVIESGVVRTDSTAIALEPTLQPIVLVPVRGSDPNRRSFLRPWGHGLSRLVRRALRPTRSRTSETQPLRDEAEQTASNCAPKTNVGRVAPRVAEVHLHLVPRNLRVPLGHQGLDEPPIQTQVSSTVRPAVPNTLTVSIARWCSWAGRAGASTERAGSRCRSRRARGSHARPDRTRRSRSAVCRVSLESDFGFCPEPGHILQSTTWDPVATN